MPVKSGKAYLYRLNEIIGIILGGILIAAPFSRLIWTIVVLCSCCTHAHTRSMCVCVRLCVRVCVCVPVCVRILVCVCVFSEYSSLCIVTKDSSGPNSPTMYFEMHKRHTWAWAEGRVGSTPGLGQGGQWPQHQQRGREEDLRELHPQRLLGARGKHSRRPSP